ncbi:hypothetical alanine and leucine rich protein [Mycobacterium tuberculosis]|nr:hypothetical alanine and leucine rich protein [Mycobacterium tuberculosis]
MAPSASAATNGYDVDRLLAGYRTARAQETLFDLRDGPGAGYDEFVDDDGNVRRPGPSSPTRSPNVARRGWTGCARWCTA